MGGASHVTIANVNHDNIVDTVNINEYLVFKETNMDLHVIFGTGPVGLHTGKALLEEGKRVTFINRTGTLDPLRSSVVHGHSYEVIAADALKTEEVLRVAKGASHLYHQWATILPAIQKNLVDAALHNHAVLAVSENLYAYKRAVPEISERSPIDPPTRKGLYRQNLHTALIEAETSKGLRWTSIQASDFYGPGATGQSVFGTERFLDPLQAGKQVLMLGNLDIAHTYTYVGDFGKALALAAQSEKALGKAWIVAHQETGTTRELADMFAQGLGKTPRYSTIAPWILSVMGLFNPMMAEVPEMLYQKEEPYVVNGSLFAKEFSFVPTSLSSAVDQTLAWFKSLPPRSSASSMH